MTKLILLFLLVASSAAAEPTVSWYLDPQGTQIATRTSDTPTWLTVFLVAKDVECDIQYFAAISTVGGISYDNNLSHLKIRGSLLLMDSMPPCRQVNLPYWVRFVPKLPKAETILLGVAKILVKNSHDQVNIYINPYRWDDFDFGPTIWDDDSGCGFPLAINPRGCLIINQPYIPLADEVITWGEIKELYH